MSITREQFSRMVNKNPKLMTGPILGKRDVPPAFAIRLNIGALPTPNTHKLMKENPLASVVAMAVAGKVPGQKNRGKRKPLLPQEPPATATGRGKPAKYSESKLEARFFALWAVLRGPALIKEYVFHPTRKWRLDAAHVATRVGVEISGQIWRKGGHTTGTGIMRDAEKSFHANLLGWVVFTLTPNMIRTEIVHKIIDFVTKKSLAKSAP